ncbi:hypothetical protein GJR96_13040 [Haloferax sp. MBLA0076]|uniref:DUF7965 domain-containing protein n=1 Tax=Haloferax litoreum TaxID=2666140 RepID=A0A6A8GI62_9EURY|nr:MULTISPECIES: hypothetical protein [Haloferax]KAB1194312.1 hypothetical protein Hfx1148_12980 [Haloferax sp. CBA1148]MRX22873.1 hypothetical protein [Haloferax litoreum]
MVDAPRLEIWAVSTFNVVLLSLLGVLTGHLSGSLADVLRGFGTLEGVLVFGYLWVLTILATRWALSTGGLDRGQTGELRSLFVRGAIAGALIGAGFLVGTILAVAFVNLVSMAWTVRLDGVLPFALITLLGGGIAALVGGLVGTVLVLVDVLLFRVSTYFVVRQPS